MASPEYSISGEERRRETISSKDGEVEHFRKLAADARRNGMTELAKVFDRRAYDLDPAGAEIRFHQEHAESARRAGSTLLAEHHDRHAAALIDNPDQNPVIVGAVVQANQAVRRLMHEDSGKVSVADVFSGGSLSEATLAAVRKSLLSPEDLQYATMESLTDSKEGTSRWTVPMQGGLFYTETYHPDDNGVVEVEIQKPATAAH
jgi:hypothetical protein